VPTPEPTPEATRLDNLQYTDIKVGDSRNRFERIGTETRTAVIDVNDNIYTNGFLLWTHYNARNYPRLDSVANDPDNALITIDYPLNSQFAMLSGQVVLPMTDGGRNILYDRIISGAERRANTQAVNVLFFGDGRLLHSINHLTNSMPFDFSINVRDVGTLTIKVVGTDTSSSRSLHYNVVAFTDLVLHR
jgi:hypothetical protein